MLTPPQPDQLPDVSGTRSFWRFDRCAEDETPRHPTVGRIIVEADTWREAVRRIREIAQGTYSWCVSGPFASEEDADADEAPEGTAHTLHAEERA